MRTLILIRVLCVLALSFPTAAAEIPNAFAQRLIETAREDVGRGVVYNAEYFRMPYPAGDVAAEIGACTDLVVRAFRAAGIDLQKEIFEDKQARPAAYPKNPAGERDPDPNIDHRRCRNLIVYFRANAEELTTELDPGNWEPWRPGDIVFFNLDPAKSSPEHIGIVSDQTDVNGAPILLDNFPPGAGERFALYSFPKITAHFRWKAQEPGPRIEPRRAESRPKATPLPAATLARLQRFYPDDAAQ